MRSVMLQASTLTLDELTRLVTRARDDEQVEHVVLTEWDATRAERIKQLLPYNPTARYKHLFVGNPAPPAQDYAAILDDDFRWHHLAASTAAAQQAQHLADGWYITYETGLNVFESEEYRSRWEWYLGDMVRRLRAVKDVPIIWSPYLVGPVTARAVAGFAQTMKLLWSWYSPELHFEVHVQDGVGANLQTKESALSWLRALRAAATGVVLKVNVEWYSAPSYLAVDARERETFYRANGFPLGALWELRYYDKALSAAVPFNYWQTVRYQAPAGEAPNNRDHADDTSGPYYERAKWVTSAMRAYLSVYSLRSLGQWRSLSTPCGGLRSCNSDHYSGGAGDFTGAADNMKIALAGAKTDPTVSFAKIHGPPSHLHVSWKLPR